MPIARLTAPFPASCCVSEPLCTCRSVTMSTSAIDSLQNALTDTISGVYLKRVRLIWVRLLVLALTVPCMIVSLKVCLTTSFLLLKSRV